MRRTLNPTSPTPLNTSSLTFSLILNPSAAPKIPKPLISLFKFSIDP